MFLKDLSVFLSFMSLLPHMVHPHGRMLDPPSRMSAYLLGFSTPVNYEDMEMNCGGRAVQWQQSGGKCGICGDPWPGPRRYERPNGTMVQHNIITKAYRENDVINITLQITKGHWGWNEFRLCDITRSGGVEATQECLDENLLVSVTGETRFYFETLDTGFYTYTLVLPYGFTCSHCLLQWKWHCGNDWGCDDNVICGLGYGPQEEFYACADVVVAAKGAVIETQTPPTVTKTTTTTTTTALARSTTTATSTSTASTTPTTTVYPTSATSTTRALPSSTTTTSTTTSTPTTTTSTTTSKPTTTTSTTTTTSSTSAATASTATARNATTVKSFLDMWNYLMTNKVNISSASKLPFVSVPTNNVNSREFIGMVLGDPSSYDTHYSYPASSVQLTTTVSPYAADKYAIDRLCFVCYGNCRFEQCNYVCPSICPLRKF